MLFIRKNKREEIAKYKKGDFVNFRYCNELYFGYIYSINVDKLNNVSYTIQIGGQCPSFIYNYKEEDIMGLKER